jgi:hypothetical protein
MNQTTCLEPSKKHHEIGDLTDNLVPDNVVDQGTAQECGNVIVLDPFIPSCFHCLPLYSCNVFFITWFGELESFIRKNIKKTL